uniref:Protein shisa-like-1a n=1 Tax=Ciona intestinalis TaxID=7719 RepID=H2Y0F2_CIOIN|nr:protein shisa-like-1a [Ciona intestinalis]|eukprot:XP_002129289.1 protein shisa-like-1a [Ciona intestinalis]
MTITRGVMMIQILFLFILTARCATEICEDIVNLKGEMLQAFGCPRLHEMKENKYCCGNKSVSLTCCSNETQSIYYAAKMENLSKPRDSASLIVVSIYGGILVIIMALDCVSHFGVWKKRRQKGKTF